MDLPGGELLVERLKKMLAPGLADDDENAQPIPPQAKQKIVQSQQMIQQLTKQLNAAKEILQTKKMEMDTKIAIEKLKIEAGIFEAEITTKAQSQSERAEFLHDLEQTLLNHGHDYAMLREKQGHEAQQAAAAQQHTAEMAQQGSALAMQQAEHAQAIAPSPDEGAE
jgi:protein-disulfide isomerase-like protein with CxxC motif